MQAELTTNLRDLATQLRRRVGEVPLRRAVNYPRRGDSDAVPLEQRDVLTLLPRTFLNDNMVDFCLKRVRAELPAGEAVRPLPRAPLQR
jgi:Ulp1 family protease